MASQVVELEELKSGKFSTQEKSDFLKSFVSSVRSSLQIQAPLYMDCSNPFLDALASLAFKLSVIKYVSK